MSDNFTIEYDMLKDDFILNKNGNEIARLPRVSIIFAANECLCAAGNEITLLEDGLPVSYIKREAIEDIGEKKKIVSIKIKDNKNLTDEELEDRTKVLAFDAITVLAKEPQNEIMEHYKKIIKIFAELLDIYAILENRKNK